MEQRIHISEVNNQPALCFDTGLDPRSFARTKMSQSLIDTGYTVNSDGSHEVWKITGVNDTGGFMRVFGPQVPGKRLDLLLEKIDSISQSPAVKQEALEAVINWVKAKMFLGDKRSAAHPGASFVSQKGNVFFAPEHISTRCLFIEGNQLDRYNCPDLTGMDATAFCAGVMLYKILTGSHPYPSSDIYQDMREGVFFPVHLAAPGLNAQLTEIIQSALVLPVEKRKNQVSKSGIDILTNILEILMRKENTAVPVSSLFTSLGMDKIKKIEKEIKVYHLKVNVTVKLRRKMVNNKHLLIGLSIGIAFILFILFSTVINGSRRMTTEGMPPDTVVIAYYNAFGLLDHQFMEACIQGADKSDVNAAISLYAVLKQRQAYEGANSISIIQAKIWKEKGGELPSPNVFGVTDLEIEYLSGGENEGLLIYRAEYDLWSPFDDFARHRNDVLSLRRDRRKNWRIFEILRTES